jgi:hypothetical protein
MALFSLALKKSLSTYLNFVFAAIAASSAVLAHHYHKRVRTAEGAVAGVQGQSAAQRAARVSNQEKIFIKELSQRYGLVPNENVGLRDAVTILARMNAELNRSVPAEYSTAKTPWLQPPPKVLPTRILAGAKRTPFSLENKRMELEAQPALYQYSLTNTTSAPLPMPILYSTVRWDDPEKIVATAGIRGIADEVDRAIAIWRFVCEHRYHAVPVTEGAEEHDTVKFFSCYGYGFCDDAAQAVAGLAKLCGLQARIWNLEGHVVSEIFAGGRWLLLDADLVTYFHKQGDPRSIYGVDELSRDRESFKYFVQLGKMGPIEQSYPDFYLTTNDNKLIPVESRSDHRIEATLRPGERVVFSNFNWGTYFIGAFPQRIPRYFNGYFELPLNADTLTTPTGVEIRREGEGYTIANSTDQTQSVECTVECPFPVVGGQISSPISLRVQFEDRVFGKKIVLPPNNEISLAAAVTQVNKQPTTKFSIRISVPAGGLLKFERPPRLFTDFQFAELALLRLKNGTTEFQSSPSSPTTVSGLQGEVVWK